jgi:hypothetical protein
MAFGDEINRFNSEGVKAFTNTKYVTIEKDSIKKQW